MKKEKERSLLSTLRKDTLGAVSLGQYSDITIFSQEKFLCQ